MRCSCPPLLSSLAVVVLAALVAGGCMARGNMSGVTRAPTIELEISLSAGGDTVTKIWTLRCPPGGTLPNPAKACRRLEELNHPFAPVPKSAACTLIYGGPQTAEVGGTFKGRPVKAHFSRGNGCEIARWNRVRFLFPPG
jgi:Subtilisin inhibitor-like